VSGATGNILTNGSIFVTSAVGTASGLRLFGRVPLQLGGTLVANSANAVFQVDSLGLLNISGAPVTFSNFFNITPNLSAVRTNGTITIESVVAPALTINNGFNVSGADESLKTNGTVAILNSDIDDALNVTGGATFANGALNISYDGNLSLNKLNTVQAINITGTLVPAFTVNNGFNISGADESLRTNGTVTILSTVAPAFTVNNGFNISGSNGAMLTNGTVIITSQSGTTQGLRLLDSVQLQFGGTLAGGANAVFQVDSLGLLNISGAPVTFNNFFNITPSLSEVRTNGTVFIQNTDPDDALNVTAGFTAAGSAASNAAFRVENNGKVTIRNGDSDDALNLTSGGFSVNLGATDFMQFFPGDPNTIFTVKRMFNISAVGNVRIGSGASGTLTLLSTDKDDALNVTGGAIFANRGFNISGDDQSLQTNGTIIVSNSDLDGAVNVTGGLVVAGRGTANTFLSVGTKGWRVSDFGSLQTQTQIAAGGDIVIRSLQIPAFTVNNGFNVSGADSSLATNGTINIQNIVNKPVFSINNAFNITGDNNALRTNGTARFENPDVDDSLNVTAGFTAAGNSAGDGAFRVAGIGRVSIKVTDPDDALNVSRGTINVGTNTSGIQHRVVINQGGANQCGQLVLWDELGEDYFLFVNATDGNLMISNATPTTCTDGKFVGQSS